MSPLRSLALAVLWPLALVACITPAPSLTVPLPRNDFGDFELLVYDPTQLVVDGRSNAETGQGLWDPDVIARPDVKEIDVSWMGGACSHRPTLLITGDASHLRLELEPSPIEWSIFPVACPAVGIFFGVTLTMTVPIEQSAMTLETGEL